MNRIAAGRILAQTRRDMGYTQDEAAEGIGISTKTLSNWERTGAVGKREALFKLLDYYDIHGEMREFIILVIYGDASME